MWSMSTLGEKIRHLRSVRKESQRELGEAIHKSRDAVAGWEHNRAEPSIDDIRAIAEHYNVSMEYMLGTDSHVSRERWTETEEIYPADAFEPGVNIPIIGEVRAGPNGIAFTEIIGRQKVDTDLVEHDIRNYFWLRVKGDSMVMAGIVEGGLVLVHRQATVDDNEIAVVSLDNEEATVKRYRRVDDKVILMPENPAYREVIVPADQVYIIGRVEYATKRWK